MNHNFKIGDPVKLKTDDKKYIVSSFPPDKELDDLINDQTGKIKDKNYLNIKRFENDKEIEIEVHYNDIIPD